MDAEGSSYFCCELYQYSYVVVTGTDSAKIHLHHELFDHSYQSMGWFSFRWCLGNFMSKTWASPKDGDLFIWAPCSILSAMFLLDKNPSDRGYLVLKAIFIFPYSDLGSVQVSMFGLFVCCSFITENSTCPANIRGSVAKFSMKHTEAISTF